MSAESDKLRERAIQTERLALSISDYNAGQALKLLARQFEDEANRIEAGLSVRPEDQRH
jgi:hypothetical protein